MASTQEVSSIAEELWCSVCLSAFRDPCMLGCGHNFCLSCLESCAFSKGQHEGSCPECQAPFSLQEAVQNQVLANLSQKARCFSLEGTPPSDGRGSMDICEEHKEPLKHFCCQDEAPVCVLCQHLPQHQSHSFLPIKNAVSVYQEKLKASLDPLEDGVKQATKNQSLQLETMEDLEELREILNEQEQAMMETVKQMKEDNLADMERRLEYLKAYESSHTETISSIQAALEETNEFAFLKGIKGLMERVQDHRRDGTGEAGSDDTQEAKESEEEEDGEKEAGEKEADGEGDEALPVEWEACGEETLDMTEDAGGAVIPVDPSLRELEVSLDFEAWKEMLRSINIRGTDVPGFPYCSASQEENVSQSEGGGISEGATEKGAPVGEKDTSPTEVSPSVPGEVSHVERRAPLNRSPAVKSTPYKPPPRFLPFPPPFFQQWPMFSNVSVRGGTAVRPWAPHPRWGDDLMARGRGYPRWRPPGFIVRQVRGYHPHLQRSQTNAVNYGPIENRGSPRKEVPQPQEAYVRREAGGGSIKQNAPPHGSDTSGQSGGSVTKRDALKSSEVPVSGQGGGQLSHQGLPPSGNIGSGDREGKVTNKQHFNPRGRSTSRRGAPGRVQGAAKKPSASQKEGDTQGSKEPPKRAQPSRQRAHSAGSTKGPQKK